MKESLIEQSRPIRSLEPTAGRAQSVVISKYNRYVDNILNRINKVLKNGYDPVNVRLHTVKSNKKGQGNKKDKVKQKKKKRDSKSRRNHSKRQKNQDNESFRSLIERSEPIAVESTTVPVTETEAGTTTDITSSKFITTTLKTPVSMKKQDETISRARPKQKKNNVNKNKKNDGKQTKPRAKATLFGLATLKRLNDVTVNLMSSHNTIKSKFLLGPLTLKVEKEFGRGAKKEIRSATATTTEMVGKINLRVLPGGVATLHSIRVMQPNLLRVDSPDDHDKTREFVWKRSSHIAEIVSRKLNKAARSLLQKAVKPKKKNTSTSSIFPFCL